MGEKRDHKEMKSIPYEVFAKALFENYESIYAVDMESGAYQRYHASSVYQKLRLGRDGNDFFGELPRFVKRVIHPEDQAYVLEMLGREKLFEGMRQNKYYAFVYRLCVDGIPFYHQTRATSEMIDGRNYALLGVRNIDTLMQIEKEHSEELASMLQKEQNHMRAILGSAAGYLEANLTRDRVLEVSPTFSFDDLFPVVIPITNDKRRYSHFEKWLMENYVSENAEKYAQISDREYLLDLLCAWRKTRVSLFFHLREG